MYNNVVEQNVTDNRVSFHNGFLSGNWAVSYQNIGFFLNLESALRFLIQSVMIFGSKTPPILLFHFFFCFFCFLDIITEYFNVPLNLWGGFLPLSLSLHNGLQKDPSGRLFISFFFFSFHFFFYQVYFFTSIIFLLFVASL